MILLCQFSVLSSLKLFGIADDRIVVMSRALRKVLHVNDIVKFQQYVSGTTRFWFKNDIRSPGHVVNMQQVSCRSEHVD